MSSPHVMLTPPLLADLAKARTASEQGAFLPAKAEAPRGRITDLAEQDGDILAMAPDSGVHRFRQETGKWLPTVEVRGAVSTSRLGLTTRFVLTAGS